MKRKKISLGIIMISDLKEHLLLLRFEFSAKGTET